MFTRPPGLADSLIVDALAAHWGFDVSSVEYAPVGFGSHHWRTRGGSREWFVTVDDLDAKRRDRTDTISTARDRLIAALEAARVLAAAGLEFVVAPTSARHGSVACDLTPGYLAAVYPYVAGETFVYGSYETHAERVAVVDLLADLHRSPRESVPRAPVDDFSIANRDGLEAAMDDLGTPWTSGPFAESCRDLLRVHADAVAATLARYDARAADALSQPDRFVVTHGEPHRANTILSPRGLMLIDWDTTLVAPPERDLWALISEDSSVATIYAERTGTAIVDDVVELYRLSWDLNEIAIYVSQFRRDHIESEDTTEAWTSLQQFLDPSRW